MGEDIMFIIFVDIFCEWIVGIVLLYGFSNSYMFIVVCFLGIFMVVGVGEFLLLCLEGL